MLVPSLTVIALVALYPLGKTILQSFTDEQFLGLAPTKWVGLQNYRDLWHDPILRHSIGTTVKFALITIPMEFVLGTDHRPDCELALPGPRSNACDDARSVGDPDGRRGADVEVDVQRHLRRGERPTPPAHHLDPPAWTANPRTSLDAVSAVDIWKTTPFMTLLHPGRAPGDLCPRSTRRRGSTALNADKRVLAHHPAAV